MADFPAVLVDDPIPTISSFVYEDDTQAIYQPLAIKNVSGTVYYMRAFNTSLNQYVYWTSIEPPDLSGYESGYSISDLENPTIVRIKRGI